MRDSSSGILTNALQQLQSRFLINLGTYTHGEAIAGDGYKLRSLFLRHIYEGPVHFLALFIAR
jgi:hypothetical protein